MGRRVGANAYFSFVNGLCLFYQLMPPSITKPFSHDGCNIFPGLSINKENNTLLTTLKPKLACVAGGKNKPRYNSPTSYAG